MTDENSTEGPFRSLENKLLTGVALAGLSFVAGAVGGICIAEAARDHFEILRQAPAVVRYTLDIAAGLGMGAVSAAVPTCAIIIPGMYQSWVEAAKTIEL